MSKPMLMIPSNFMYGLDLGRRILDTILYEVDSSEFDFMRNEVVLIVLIAVISHDGYYSQFYHPSCELVQ
jgi:hypothetical protein